MNVKKLIGIDQGIDNVVRLPFPYWWAFQGVKLNNGESSVKKVIFFGNDMAGFTKIGIDTDDYIKRCNRCLDFIRREFTGRPLYYKPHPADKTERTLLDLKNFNVLNNETNAELFLFNNINDIEAVFSVNSASAYGAYAMGVNSYVFYKCFGGVYDSEITKPLDEFFYDMPKSFFIKDFNEKIVENAPKLKKDEVLESLFSGILTENKGKVWFIAFTVEHIVTLISLAKLIKSIDPSRKIGLVVSKHKYWEQLNSENYSKYFNEIVIWPRINYSLRPMRLVEALKLVREIKNFKIGKGDTIISITQNSFVENCINSYFKRNLRIGIIPDKDLKLFYDSSNSVYGGYGNFRFNKASWFFNRIFEPMLGLSRTLFLLYGGNTGFYITRYQKPLNHIFDKVIILNVPKNV